MDDKLKKNVLGYPSHFVDPQLKQSPEYCAAFAEAFDSEATFSPYETFICRENQINFDHLRKLARGQQDPNQYKEKYGLKRNNGKKNRSFRSLNFEIVKIAPKFRDHMINRLVSQDYRINVKALDSMAMNARRKVKSEIEAYRASYEQIQEFERISALQVDKNVTEEQLNMTPQELDVHLDMNPSDMTSSEIKDYLLMNLGLNNWGQKSEDISGNLTDLGVGAVHVFIDEAGVIRQESLFPEKVVTNKCVKNDFSDMIRVGVYQDMTVADLKRKTKGAWGEEEYARIAREVAEFGSSKYSKTFSDYWNQGTYTYAYDHEKVTVFTCYWFSVDQYTYEELKDANGNTDMVVRPWAWVPGKGDESVNGGKGFTDQEYAQQTGGARIIYRNEIKNVYRCSWVKGTKKVFDYGLMTSMPRYAKSMAETCLPIIIQTTNFMSPFGNIENILDMFQLQWLQFQSHTAASKPPGIMIERNSLIKAGMKSGQASKSVNWKELLQMYAETGSIVFDGYDGKTGQALPWFPVQEIKNGLSPGAQEHFTLMIQMLDLIRTLLGINELVDGQAPPERLGKGVAQLTFGAADLNLSHMTRAYKAIYERTCKMVVDLMPDAFDQGVLPSFIETLGMESYQFFNLNKDINLRDMGIEIEEGVDNAVQERIVTAINIAIEKGELDAEDAIIVEMEKNPYKIIQILKMKRKEKIREAQKMQFQNMDYQSQKNQEDAQVAGQIQQQNLQIEMQATEQQMTLQHGMNMSAEEKKFLHAYLLKKLDNKQQLTVEEERYMHEYSRDVLKIKGAMRVQALANQKPRPTTSKTR